MEEIEIVRLIFAGITVTLCIVGFIIYNGMNNRRIIMMKEHAVEIIKNEQKQEVLKAIIKTEEKERMRIARDLHDSLGPTLAMIQHTLSRQAHPSQTPVREELNAVVDQLDKVVDGFRSACYHLYPFSLKKYGLVEVLRQITNSIGQTSSSKVEFKANLCGRQFNHSPEVALHILRIYQEVTSNLLKHARCSWILVVVETTEKETFISIVHDGQPFADADVKSKDSQGHGLTSIAARLAVIRGHIHYGNRCSDTVVEIKIPMEDGEDKNHTGR